jgi:hypothetical protein
MISDLSLFISVVETPFEGEEDDFGSSTVGKLVDIRTITTNVADITRL